MGEEPEVPFSAELYFKTQSAPPTLDDDVGKVREFIKRQKTAGRKVAFVTSGGTTVPLEQNVVRFLDNFSAGTRGATSAEYFLQHGYAVIFMHRQYSLQPFSRHYSHSLNPFLDFLDITLPTEGCNTQPSEVHVNESTLPHLIPILSTYKEVHRMGTLHSLTFVTVDDYLFLLRAISKELAELGGNVIYYLAAAVSDFFLPTQKMSKHKIQSGKGNLQIAMDQVPKILKPLVDEWTPEGFIVSFKLETDPEILIPKAKSSLERYGHQLVIGNLLNTRKFEVVLVGRQDLIWGMEQGSVSSAATTKAGEQVHLQQLEDGDVVQSWLRLRDGRTEIEEDLIAQLVKYHDAWIQNPGKRRRTTA